MSFPLSRPKPVVAQWHEEARRQPDHDQNDQDPQNQPNRIACGDDGAGWDGRCSTTAKQQQHQHDDQEYRNHFGLGDGFAARRFNPARWAGSVASQRRSSSDFSTAEDRLGQRNRCGYYGSRTKIPCRMSLPGGVLDQPCVSRPETTQRPVAQTDFQLAGHHDDVLTPRGRMPVQKGSGRLFSKYNKLSRLRFG